MKQYKFTPIGITVNKSKATEIIVADNFTKYPSDSYFYSETFKRRNNRYEVKIETIVTKSNRLEKIFKGIKSFIF